MKKGFREKLDSCVNFENLEMINIPPRCSLVEG